VQGQSSQSFQWLLFFDSSLPDDLRGRVATYSRFSPFRAVYVEGAYCGRMVCKAVRECGDPAEYVITSRVDNDDALAINYIETVQSQFNKQAFEFLNLPNGYVWDGVQAYSHKDPSNAFISLVERKEQLKTVLSFDHTKVSVAGPIRQLHQMPGWLVIVHGDNVRNSTRGKKAEPGQSWKRHFAIPDHCYAAPVKYFV
jgi:hypothetical protein